MNQIVDTTPAIISNGGGATASVSTPENTTAVTTVTATDPDSGTLTYSIGGGPDAALFGIDGSNRALAFLAAPDFENPTDSGTNNVYDVTVQVSDGLLASTQAIAVTVTPVNDPPIGTDNTVTTLENKPYAFAVGDFGFSDPNDTPPNSLLAVKIDTLPGAGTFTDHGSAVMASQFIPVADITNGLLQFMPSANAKGDAYASFTFQVQDDGGLANGGIDLTPATNTITINVMAVRPAPIVVSGTPDGTALVLTTTSNGQISKTPADMLAPFGDIGTSVRTATADVNGDGVPDTILVTAPGTPLRVAVINGKDESVMVAPLDPFGGNFMGGGFVTAGDFDSSGEAQFVVTPDEGGGPRGV